MDDFRGAIGSQGNRVAIAAAVEYRIGTRVPDSVRLDPVPETAAVEVPAVRAYKYMVVIGGAVPVDPATSEVVAEFAD